MVEKANDDDKAVDGIKKLDEVLTENKTNVINKVYANNHDTFCRS